MQNLREWLVRMQVRSVVHYVAYRGDDLARLLIRPHRRAPYPLYDRIRSNGVCERSVLGPIYVSASHAFVTQALRTAELSVLEHPPAPSGLVRPVEDSFVMLNRPDHPRLRRLVTPWFTAKALQRRRDDLLGIAHLRLDELAGRSSFDLVQDYAVPVAVRVACAMTGLPAHDWRRLAALGEILPISTNSTMPAPPQQRRLEELWRDLNRYLDEAVAARAAPEGSLLASLTEHAQDPGQLNRHDLLATLGALLIAGFETTVGLIGALSSRFIDEVDLRRAALADSAALGAAVEESLRFEPPVQFTMRRVVEDCSVAGVPLPAGSEVMLLLAGASRDPEVFEQPNEFWPTRPNSKAHLAFSGGEHYCLGAGLARLESEIAVQALFERMPGLRRKGRPSWQPAQNIRALRNIPVGVS